MAGDQGAGARLTRETRRMDQRISFVTLAVADLETTRRFYLDGLG